MKKIEKYKNWKMQEGKMQGRKNWRARN